MKLSGTRNRPLFIAIAAVLAGCIWFFNTDSMALTDIPGGGQLDASQLPVKGMVTMIDLGADKCIPCKMMAPILKEAEEQYRGKAVIVFLDVWKDPSHGKRFGIKAIPTQIFFDKDGTETYRHEGFLSKKAIDGLLKDMGVL